MSRPEPVWCLGVSSEKDEPSRIRAALKLVEQLQRATGQRDIMDVVQSEWREARPDFDELFALAKKLGIVEVLTLEKQPEDTLRVRVKMKFYTMKDETEQEDTRAVHRQVTVNGEKIDLRSPTNYMIATASPSALAMEIRTQLFNLRNAPEMRTRIGSEMRLRRIALLRWNDIPVSQREEIEQALMSHEKWRILRKGKSSARKSSK